MKGQNQNSLWVNLLLVLAASIVILLLFTGFSNVLGDSVRDKACLSMITAKTLSSVEVGPFAYENEMIVKCPPYKLSFEDEEAKLIQGNKKVKTFDYEEINKEEVFDKIADEMIACWDKFGSGNLDVFSIPQTWRDEYKDLLGGITDWTGCRTCTEINFDLENQQSFEGFGDYMKETKLVSRSKQQNSPGNTIYDYIALKDRYCNSKYEGNCYENYAENKLKLDTNLSFDTQLNYEVVFVRQETEPDKGTLNVYVMSTDTKKRVCQSGLPYR